MDQRQKPQRDVTLPSKPSSGSAEVSLLREKLENQIKTLQRLFGVMLLIMMAGVAIGFFVGIQLGQNGNKKEANVSERDYTKSVTEAVQTTGQVWPPENGAGSAGGQPQLPIVLDLDYPAIWDDPSKPIPLMVTVIDPSGYIDNKSVNYNIVGAGSDLLDPTAQPKSQVQINKDGQAIFNFKPVDPLKPGLLAIEVNYQNIRRTAYIQFLAKPSQSNNLKNVDIDNDGLSDTLEGMLGSDPNLADTDNDGVSDGLEVYNLHTNPKASNLYKINLNAIKNDDQVVPPTLLIGNDTVLTFKGDVQLFVFPAREYFYSPKTSIYVYIMLRFKSDRVINDLLPKSEKVYEEGTDKEIFRVNQNKDLPVVSQGEWYVVFGYMDIRYFDALLPQE